MDTTARVVHGALRLATGRLPGTHAGRDRGLWATPSVPPGPGTDGRLRTKVAPLTGGGRVTTPGPSPIPGHGPSTRRTSLGLHGRFDGPTKRPSSPPSTSLVTPFDQSRGRTSTGAPVATPDARGQPSLAPYIGNPSPTPGPKDHLSPPTDRTTGDHRRPTVTGRQVPSGRTHQWTDPPVRQSGVLPGAWSTSRLRQTNTPDPGDPDIGLRPRVSPYPDPVRTGTSGSGEVVHTHPSGWGHTDPSWKGRGWGCTGGRPVHHPPPVAATGVHPGIL